MGINPTQKAVIGTYINGRNSEDDFLQLATNDGGKIFGWIDAQGILQGSLASEPPNLINILDFGADPTGLVDSTAAIQAAIDQTSTSLPGIFVPAGVYTISSALVGTANLQQIIGAGPQSSVIQVANSSATYSAFTTTMCPLAPVIKNIGFTGPGQTATGGQDGLSVSSSGNLGVIEGGIFENVYLLNWPGRGLFVDTPITTNVSNCRALDCGKGFYAVNGTSTNWDNNYALRCLKTGYELSACSYMAFSACAADFCGISYKSYGCIGITFNGCGHEAGTAYNVTVTSTALTSDVATITYTGYDLSADYVPNHTPLVVAGTANGAGIFNGRQTIISATSNTVTFGLTSGDVAEASDTGTASAYPGDGLSADDGVSFVINSQYGTDAAQISSAHIVLIDCIDCSVLNPVSTLSVGQTQTDDIIISAGCQNIYVLNPKIIGGVSDNGTASQIILNNVQSSPVTVGTSLAAVATSGGNVNSETLTFDSSFWTGSAAAQNSWKVQDVLGSGSNPVSSLQFVHGGTNGGTTGAAAAQFYIGSTTANGELDIISNTSATGSNNYGSPALTLNGSIWSGSASVKDSWLFQNTVGTGSNPVSTLQIEHSGSTGQIRVQVPTGASIEFGTDTGISRGSAGVLDVGSGAPGDASGTVNAAQFNVAGSQIAASNLSNGTTGSGSIVLSAAPTITGAVTLSGTVSSYDGVATQLGGIAPIVKSALFSSQSANISSTSILAASTLPANSMVRVSIQVVCTAAGSVSSTLPTPILTFTERYSNTSVSITLSPTNSSPTTSANTVGAVQTYCANISIRTAGAVSLSTGNYASSAAGMTFDLIANIESFGG
jgi:hypothetical protein